MITQYISDVSLLFYLIIIIIVVFRFSNGFLQSAAYGFAGMLPPRCIGALGIGSGFSGVVIAIFRAIALLIFPTAGNDRDDPNLFNGTLMYFGFSCLCCMLIFLMLIFVLRTDYVRFNSERSTVSVRASITETMFFNELAEEI